jgi:putative oxidoreductase
MKHLSFFYRTTSHISGLVIRLTLGSVLFPHGGQLLMGWFGGYGFDGTMNYLMQTEGLPWLVACSVIMLQFFGSLAVIAGILGRFFAMTMTGLFIGMIVTSHLSYGFFMNWSGTQAGEGFEYHLLAIGLSIALFIQGSGAWSVDAWLSKRNQAAKPTYQQVKRAA